jgi:hypothetical protein
MIFTFETWKTAFAERLPQWRQRMQGLGITSMYTFISAMALWPVAAAAKAGDWQALTALGGVLAGVGGNLLANRLQGWKDEADAARHITTSVSTEPALKAEVDAVLTSLEAFPRAREALPPVNTSGLTRPCVASSRARGTGNDLSPTLQALVLSPRDLALSQPERGGWRWVVICSAAPSSRVMPTALHRDDAG